MQTAMVDDKYDVEPASLTTESDNQCRITVFLDQSALLSSSDMHHNQQKLRCTMWAKREA